MRKVTCCGNPCIFLLTGFLVLIATLIFGWIIFPCVIHSKISQKVKLTKGSEIWEKWEHVPIPIYLKIYLFNVSNPDEVLNGSFPRLIEVGPFVYLENREKTDIRETENGTILYKEKITYFFQPELSGGLNEDDILTILNIPFVAMSLKISELMYPLDYLASVYVSKFKEKPFVRKTVNEILFKGWHLPIASEVEEYTGHSVLPNNSFGLFIGKNGTDDGEMEIDAGLSSTKDFGEVVSWRGKRKLDWWEDGSECNEILGTDGSIFAPFVTKKRIIRIFNAELCRSLFLTYEKDVTFLGIPAYRFSAPDELLQDPRMNGSNKCFCSGDDEDCLHSGSINLAPCRDGAPVSMSTPHFLNGYQSYIDKAGLNPQKLKHETFLDIEPTTGVVIRASKRIQVNVIMKPVPNMKSLSQLPEMLFPIVWADECAEIDDELSEELKSQLLTPLRLIDMGKWILLGFSLVVVLISFLSFLFCSSPKDVQSGTTPASNSLLVNNEPSKLPPIEMKSMKHIKKLESDENVKFPLIENLKSI